MGQLARDGMLVDHYTALEENGAVAAIAQYLRLHGDPDYLGGWQRQIGAQLTEGIDDYLREHFLGRSHPRPARPARQESRAWPAHRASPAATSPLRRSTAPGSRPPGASSRWRGRPDSTRCSDDAWRTASRSSVARRGRRAGGRGEGGLPDRPRRDSAAYPAGTKALALATLTSPRLASTSRRSSTGSLTRQTAPPGQAHPHRARLGRQPRQDPGVHGALGPQPVGQRPARADEGRATSAPSPYNAEATGRRSGRRRSSPASSRGARSARAPPRSPCAR